MAAKRPQVHRTFIVWRNYWVIIVPTAPSGLSLPSSASALNASVSTFVYLTLFANDLCTALISFRISFIRHKSIVVESAAIYTLLLLGQLITNRLGSYVNYIIVNCVRFVSRSDNREFFRRPDRKSSLTTHGIVFSYIILRVSHGAATGDSTDNTSGVVHTSLSRDRTNQHFEFTASRTRGTNTVSEVQVKLECVVPQHTDVEGRDEEGG
ncbi:hypothetical protein C8R45DRAFT_1222638 [Mycena sanguinolenta]|nr:hypothetical protein C8R45DRAFT_1222638 [Mycena sanguinolenta]